MTTVLMYHGFCDQRRQDDPENLFVPVGALHAHLDRLAAGRWRPLDLDQYLGTLNGGGRTRRRYLVTVDDGFLSAADIAAPIFASRRVPWVLFVPPGLLGGSATWLPEPADEPLLDVNLLRELVHSGAEVGGHGWDHHPMSGLSDEELRRHTVDVRECLADLTGRPPRAFAYPYGDFDDRALRAVASAGFEVAFSVFKDSGRFAVSRVDVNASDSAASFTLKLMPGYRRVWRIADHVRPLRRGVRVALTQAGRSKADRLNSGI